MCWFSESNSHVYVHQCPDLVLNHEILFFKNIHELVLYLKSFVLYGRETCWNLSKCLILYWIKSKYLIVYSNPHIKNTLRSLIKLQNANGIYYFKQNKTEKKRKSSN